MVNTNLQVNNSTMHLPPYDISDQWWLWKYCWCIASLLIVDKNLIAAQLFTVYTHFRKVCQHILSVLTVYCLSDYECEDHPTRGAPTPSHLVGLPVAARAQQLFKSIVHPVTENIKDVAPPTNTTLIRQHGQACSLVGTSYSKACVKVRVPKVLTGP